MLIRFVGSVLYASGPTIVDQHGDGLWVGAIALFSGLLIGYASGKPE